MSEENKGQVKIYSVDEANKVDETLLDAVNTFSELNPHIRIIVYNGVNPPVAYPIMGPPKKT